MARRLTTAEILAAARSAAAGTAAPSATTAVKPAQPSTRPTSSAAELNAVEPDATLPSPKEIDGASSANPVSIETILRQVKGEREGDAAPADHPPSMAMLLARIRGVQGEQSVTDSLSPPSMAAILTQLRGTGGGRQTTDLTPTTDRSTSVTEPSGSATKRRPSTAEILAAARNRTGGGTPAASPAAESNTPAPKSRTASILEAARRQGRASTSGQAAAGSPKPKSVGKTVAAGPGGAVATARSPAGRPRPKSMTDVLAAVRAAAAGDYGQTQDSLPSLTDMMAALRTLNGHSMISQPPLRSASMSPDGWWHQVRHWLGLSEKTHRGASI